MSTFGHFFRVTTFGESHCAAVGCVIDGMPPGLPLTAQDIQFQLDRRRPGQSSLTTPRSESDTIQILAGMEHNITLGSPLSLLVWNKDQRPSDYQLGMADQCPRPSHADLTYLFKYGVKSSSGGGRSSARETIGRVAAGAVAEKWLQIAYGVDIVAFVSSVGPIQLTDEETQNLLETVTRSQVDEHAVRCPLSDKAKLMSDYILQMRQEKDSTGGVITCVIRNVPTGLGEPCFDKLEALLAHGMLSIPSTKGFTIGSGYQGAQSRGSQHNDPFIVDQGHWRTSQNKSGGVQGGISNGMPITFTVAFKPPATIGAVQQTANYQGEPSELAAEGRHDPCVVMRAVPIVEAMAALVLIDCVLMQLAREASFELIKDKVPPLPASLSLAVDSLDKCLRK